MRRKLSDMGQSMRMMWGCVALLVVVGIVAVATSAYVLLFVIPCMVMMVAMVWMMMGGSGTRHDQRR
ncbi:MAG: hypothetical protein ACYDHN_04785 [Solirubrobacteraceae bacterium]